MGFNILDASAFYAGVPFQSQEMCYTTPLIYDEIKHIKKAQGVLDVLCDTGRLTVMEPDTKYTKVAVRAAKKTGDFEQLSIQDVSVIALGLDIGGEIITDDFAISNVADSLGISISPIMTSGIRGAGRWLHYCPGCKIEQRSGKVCNRCGISLKKRLVKGQSRAVFSD